MGNTAARKLREIVENTRRVVAIEAFAACQAIDFREGFTLGKGTGMLYKAIRKEVPFLEQDVVMYEKMDQVYEVLNTVL